MAREMAREMEEHRKWRMESTAKIMIGKIGGTNKAVQEVQMGNAGKELRWDSPALGAMKTPRQRDPGEIGIHRFRMNTVSSRSAGGDGRPNSMIRLGTRGRSDAKSAGAGGFRPRCKPDQKGTAHG